MPSDRHDPKYNNKGGTCIVKCSCGGFNKEYPTRGKAMKAWADHYKAKTN